MVLGGCAAEPGGASRAAEGKRLEAAAGFPRNAPPAVRRAGISPNGHCRGKGGISYPPFLLLYGRSDPCSCSCKPGDTSRALRKFGTLSLTYTQKEPLSLPLPSSEGTQDARHLPAVTLLSMAGEEGVCWHRMPRGKKWTKKLHGAEV